MLGPSPGCKTGASASLRSPLASSHHHHHHHHHHQCHPCHHPRHGHRSHIITNKFMVVVMASCPERELGKDLGLTHKLPNTTPSGEPRLLGFRVSGLQDSQALEFVTESRGPHEETNSPQGSYAHALRHVDIHTRSTNPGKLSHTQ